ncbi:ABC transporter permease [Clostridium sp. MSJ-11]|uniref:ABC transporter permease n=1 Tax=Clostridium mobile TaxID=2841512 RepID=A0ABS6EEH4_9CLOT|nr:ABC transporter permease [Clostridium mobile]MBU5483615.1 ABC transporter permease [Clostridium mobile]
MSILINILEQGLIFSIMAVGVYITYGILDFPDLSVDGTFPLGASVTAMCLIKGIDPFIACLLAFIAGGIGGAITGLFHVKFKITNLMSGILVMIALYSINLRIMGKSNIPLFGIDTIFTPVSSPIIIIVIFALASKVILDLFLKTKLGFILKATGDNDQLVTSLGVNKDTIKILGLIISNGLVALSGSIMAQYQGFADVGMGTGIVVMGLAAVIIGESIFKKASIVKGTTMAILGSIIYKAIIAIALQLGLEPTDLKLVTVIIVVIALSLNNKKFNFKTRKKVPMGGGVLVTDK